MPRVSSQTERIIRNAARFYHQREWLKSDPLEFVHGFSSPWDQEAVALGAALLAYGNVKQIRASIREWLNRVLSSGSGNGGDMAAWVRSLQDTRGVDKANGLLQGWKHRFNTGEDLVLLFRLLSRSWQEYGSLGGHFTCFLSGEHSHTGEALERLIAQWSVWADEMGVGPESSFRFFLTSPAQGSCCKRWCLLLLWMGRRDALDPGLWTEKGGEDASYCKTLQGRFVRPDQLVIPLDTHLSRIARKLKLTHRKSADWKTALEVTESLKQIDPKDPVRFDFALSRLGIVGGWKGGSLEWLNTP